MKFRLNFNILITVFLLVNVFLASCSDDEICDYELTSDSMSIGCVPFEMNSATAGFTVATCYAAVGTEPVGVIFDTRFNSLAPIGDDWGIGLNNPTQTIHPPNWTPNDIGQVFGIAIDDSENIFLAASNIYQQGVFPTPPGNLLPGQVYKCSAPTWNATPVFSVPNSGGTLNGIGNIAYDKLNNQLLVSNLENGMIYRFDTNGVQLGTPYDPWSPDTGGAGIATQEEQVWGIGVNYEGGIVKLYYARVALAPNPERSIYSVTLNADGSFPAITNDVLEISNVSGNQDVITDIAFSSSMNEMLISERGNPHSAKVLSYSRLGGNWSANLQYFVGGNAANDGENSAGGVDFAFGEIDEDIGSECDSFFWASGNFMGPNNVLGKVYGLQGVAYSGNNSESAPSPTGSNETDIFIDFNGSYTTLEKNTIGDVETFDASQCFNLCDF